jgi:SAM-dependent methyltransferase
VVDEHRHGTPAADHQHHLAFDSPEAAAFAELEAEVLVGLLDDAASTLAGLCRRDGIDVRRVLDVGCGPGVGACRLAELFPSARVVAVDGSPAMLARAAARAERLGLAERVEIRSVELPASLEALGRADIVWASMVLHHIGDELGVLRHIRELLTAGGLLAVLEWAGPLRVLPDEADPARPGIWQRLDAASAAWFAEMRAALAAAAGTVAYPAILEAAGFEVVADELLTLVLGAPLDAAARRFAREYVLRARAQLARHADPADLDALAVLVAEDADDAVTCRGDVTLRAQRRLFVARP